MVPQCCCIQMPIESQPMQLGKWNAFSLPPSTTRTYITNDACISANGIPVDWVIDGAISHTSFLHGTHNGFKRLQILCRVSVELNIADVSAIGQRMVWCLPLDFFKSRNRIINRNMKRIGVIFAVCNPRNIAEARTCPYGQSVRIIPLPVLQSKRN